MNQLNQQENLYLNLHMKIKDNDYYEKLYVRLLKAYDLKRNNHTQVELYNIYAKKYNYMNDYNYKKYIYDIFNNYRNIEAFGFQFNSEEELLINLDLRGI